MESAMEDLQDMFIVHTIEEIEVRCCLRTPGDHCGPGLPFTPSPPCRA